MTLKWLEFHDRRFKKKSTLIEKPDLSVRHEFKSLIYVIFFVNKLKLVFLF